MNARADRVLESRIFTSSSKAHKRRFNAITKDIDADIDVTLFTHPDY